MIEELIADNLKEGRNLYFKTWLFIVIGLFALITQIILFFVVLDRAFWLHRLMIFEGVLYFYWIFRSVTKLGFLEAKLEVLKSSKDADHAAGDSNGGVSNDR